MKLSGNVCHQRTLFTAKLVQAEAKRVGGHQNVALQEIVIVCIFICGNALVDQVLVRHMHVINMPETCTNRHVDILLNLKSKTF